MKEKTQYMLTFGVIATMFLVVGFPPLIIGFFGVFVYFLWKTFVQSPPGLTREIFEFYLTANEILRNEDRKWFGFEMQEVIHNGEMILQRMNGAPPLVYFTLGALYHKIGNYKAAVNHLGYVMENDVADESKYMFATPELKEYVRILRKIEREPAEAPQTSAAIRALERSRRNRGKVMLDESRLALLAIDTDHQLEQPHDGNEGRILKSLFSNDSIVDSGERSEDKSKTEPRGDSLLTEHSELLKDSGERKVSPKGGRRGSREHQTARKPITELLHDIYDK